MLFQDKRYRQREFRQVDLICWRVRRAEERWSGAAAVVRGVRQR
jgi:hypothetical protein